MKNSYKDNDCDSDISQTMKLVAIKSNGTTYIIDEYTFRITREENLPKGVMKFSSFVREKMSFCNQLFLEDFMMHWLFVKSRKTMSQDVKKKQEKFFFLKNHV